MLNSSKHFNDLLLSLENLFEKPLYNIVCDFEEAVVLSITIGHNSDSQRLIQAYKTYFQDPIPHEIEFFCAFQQGVLLWRSGDLESAECQFKDCMTIAKGCGDLHSAARSSMALGVLCIEKGRYTEALDLMEKAETGLRIPGGDLLSRCLNWLGIICGSLKLYKRAWSYYREALELIEELGLRKNQEFVLCNIGYLCQRMGLNRQDGGCFRDAMKIQEVTGNNYGLADAMANLGMLLLKKEDKYQEAEPFLKRSVEMHMENSTFSKAGLVFVSQAAVSYLLGEKQKAVELFDRARDLVFSKESWTEQVDYCATRAEILLEMGDIDEAEKLLLQGMEIGTTNLPGSDIRNLASIYSRLLCEKGDYKAAYLQLLASNKENEKLDAVKSEAMESVIYGLMETSRGKKKLQRIEEEARLLEEKNCTLRLSEERFRGLVNRMTNIGVIAVDSMGVVTFWNETCTSLYGYRDEEACGRKLSDLIIPEHLRDWLTAFIQSGVTDGEFEVNLKALDGRMKSVLLSLVPFEKGETFIIQVDLTSQRHAENQRSLIEAQMRRTQKLEALGTLAGGIAHDFNNLLQGILGNAALLCESLGKRTPEVSRAEMIKSAAERSADLCVQMLDYAGVKPVSHEPIDINHVIGDISSLMETSLSKDVALLMDLSNRVVPVMGDRSQMRQVVMNLVLNGAEAIQGTGEVVISTDFVFRKREQFRDNLLEESPNDGDYVLLKVKDSGTGIDPETLTRIFDPFFSTKKTGRGLGLAAVLGIIRGHSGAIMVYSEPGKGTEFNIYLKAADRISVEEKEEIMGDLEKEHTGKKILVVDDEEIVRETILDILDSLGFEAAAVHGGAEAFVLLESGDIPDLMLLDLTMPGLNGADVFKRVRDMGFIFPVLVVSGYSEEKLSSLFPNSGPDGFLQKPFSPESLKSKLNYIFSSI